jgi:opacity protein-like surface antigen
MRKLNALEGVVLAILIGLFNASRTEGAENAAPGSGYALAKGSNEFGLWGGGSPDTAKVFGNVEDRKLFLVALRYGRILAAWESFSLEYTVDVFPVAIYSEPDHVRSGSSTLYGGGLSPFGFKINFLQQSWIQPFIAASVGFLYFQDDVPVPHSSRFNFTPELGVGVQFFVAPKRALTLGYKFHHMSNANTGESNPGMDSNVLYAGFSFFTP